MQAGLFAFEAIALAVTRYSLITQPFRPSRDVLRILVCRIEHVSTNGSTG